MIEYDFVRVVESDGDACQAFRGVFLIASRPTPYRVECFEYDPPKPPSSLRFKFDHNNESLIVSWEFPPNPQGDIKKFQIFRRESVDNPFTLLAEYDFNNAAIKYTTDEVVPERDSFILKDESGDSYVSTVYSDNDFDKSKSFIYAVASIDAHGMTSNYSAQFQVNYDAGESKIMTKIISKAGAPKPYPNLYLNQDSFVDVMKVSNKSRVNVYFDPEFYEVYKETLQNDGTIQKTFSNLISKTNSNKVTYKINFINTDLQKSTNLDIKVSDLATVDVIGSVAALEANNLSFNLKS
jgi:hypothetical protein